MKNVNIISGVSVKFIMVGETNSIVGYPFNSAGHLGGIVSGSKGPGKCPGGD